MRKAALILVAAFLAVGLAGVATAQEPHVEASPQVTDEANVTIDDVEIVDGDGFVVVHEEPAGENHTADTVLGATAVEEGEHEDVEVELDEELEERQLLYAVLYYYPEDEFDFTEASVAETENEEGELVDVEDDFYVVVGDPDHERLGDSYQSLAENLQQRHDFREQLSDLEDRLDELDESDDPEVEESKEEVRDEIDSLEGDIDELDSQINNTTTLINDILEAEEELSDDEETNGEDSDGEEDDAEGLPGFTAFAAVLSLIGFTLFARRHE